MTEEVAQPEQLAAGSITTWPTTEQFINEATRDEAVAFAAAEILEVHAQMVKTVRALQKTSIPVAVKLFFEKKCRTAMNNLYGACPLTVQEHVELMVLTEMAGGPEALEKMAKEIAAEEAAQNGVVDGKVPNETVNLAPLGQDGSSPSDATISTEAGDAAA